MLNVHLHICLHLVQGTFFWEGQPIYFIHVYSCSISGSFYLILKSHKPQWQVWEVSFFLFHSMQKLVFVAPISVFKGLDILVSLHGNLKGVHFLKEEIPKETEVNCMGGGRVIKFTSCHMFLYGMVCMVTLWNKVWASDCQSWKP